MEIRDLRAKQAIASQNGRAQVQARLMARSSFTEPKWVLAAPEGMREDVGPHSRRALFQVTLRTSKDYGSDISYLDAAVLLALIGEHGRCFVYRIGTPALDDITAMNQPAQAATKYRFQRGSQDVISFFGPDLGNLVAVWVAPERGTWRMEEINIVVFPQKDINVDVDEGPSGKIMQYDFMNEGLFIGDGGTNPAAELRPSKMCALSLEDYHRHISTLKLASSAAPLSQARDQGLKEYEMLKVSLLGYDALLVTLGSIVASAAGYHEVAEGYFVGGLMGLLYLVILQRAVDQLPVLPPLTDDADNSKIPTGAVVDVDAKAVERSQSLRTGNSTRFRAPLTKVSGILAAGILVVKAATTSSNQSISKELLFAGVAGFLVSKVATVMASNMPLSAKAHRE